MTDRLAEWITGCRRGDAAAQRALYQRYYTLVMSIAVHYAGQREEAEEIAQDVFVKLFRSLTKRDITGNFEAYLSRITINASIDVIRKRNRTLFTEELTDYAPTREHHRNTGTDALEMEEIYRLLQKLPPAYRLVFNLHVLEGLEHTEIAKRLGISSGTSRSNLFKARAKLRELATTYYNLNDA